MEQLENDLKAAMQAGRKLEVSTLRLLKNALANARISKGSELDEAEKIKVLQKEAKQRRESIASFEAAGRSEQAENEAAELEIIEGYLPEQLSEAELAELAEETIRECGASSPADTGKVMKQLQAKVAGRADGSLAAKIVREKLQ